MTQDEIVAMENGPGQVPLPIQVAARWPSVPGSHKYAGAEGCHPGSFGDDSEDLFTTAQMRDYGDRRAAAEREQCAAKCKRVAESWGWHQVAPSAAIHCMDNIRKRGGV